MRNFLRVFEMEVVTPLPYDTLRHWRMCFAVYLADSYALISRPCPVLLTKYILFLFVPLYLRGSFPIASMHALRLTNFHSPINDRRHFLYLSFSSLRFDPNCHH